MATHTEESFRSSSLRSSYVLYKDQLKLILDSNNLGVVSFSNFRNWEVLCNWIPQQRHSESRQRTNHARKTWMKWMRWGSVCGSVIGWELCVTRPHPESKLCLAMLTTWCDTRLLLRKEIMMLGAQMMSRKQSKSPPLSFIKISSDSDAAATYQRGIFTVWLLVMPIIYSFVCTYSTCLSIGYRLRFTRGQQPSIPPYNGCLCHVESCMQLILMLT